jgi:hypothetical protein
VREDGEQTDYGMTGKWWLTDRDKIIHKALVASDFGGTHKVSCNSTCVCMQNYLSPQVLLYESVELFLYTNCSEGT